MHQSLGPFHHHLKQRKGKRNTRSSILAHLPAREAGFTSTLHTVVIYIHLHRNHLLDLKVSSAAKVTFGKKDTFEAFTMAEKKSLDF